MTIIRYDSISCCLCANLDPILCSPPSFMSTIMNTTPSFANYVHTILCSPCRSSCPSSPWCSSHMLPSGSFDVLHQIATFTFKRWWRPLTKCGMSEAIDQSVNYINLRYFHHLLLFPPLGTNARPEKPAKIHSSDTVLLGTKHFIIIWKESNRGASRHSIYYTSTWHFLMESFWWGRPNIWLVGKGEIICGGKYFVFAPIHGYFLLW